MKRTLRIGGDPATGGMNGSNKKTMGGGGDMNPKEGSYDMGDDYVLSSGNTDSGMMSSAKGGKGGDTSSDNVCYLSAADLGDTATAHCLVSAKPFAPRRLTKSTPCSSHSLGRLFQWHEQWKGQHK